MRQPHYPPELFKLHALMGFIGMRGSGKTHAMVNLTKKYLEEKSFNRIFIISPTYHSNPIFHVLKPQEEDVYTDPQE
jgi:predicted AAA+ superfamily ATPase